MAARSQISEDQFLDPRWRLANLYTIKDENGRAVPFRPNTVQTDFLDRLHDRNIILKARQLGFTTLIDLVLLDATVFTPNTAAMIIAHKIGDAEEIFTEKIKFPYDQLDEGIRGAVPLISDRADRLEFANGSKVRVSTSARSGTLQYLHVSEFGKLCAQFPDRAKEVVSGALNAVHAGGFVAIESTAEGQDGAFYRMAQESRRKIGRDLHTLDYKFHFYPWFGDQRYRLSADSVVVSDVQNRYFDKLEMEKGAVIDAEQRAWYAAKELEQGGDMKREYPSTPDEAFEQALEGCYFEAQLLAAHRTNRIRKFPIARHVPVNTFWDLGRNDMTAIWLHQRLPGVNRFVGYYENSGEDLSHYARWLKEWASDRQVVFGDHYAPHDGGRGDLFLPEGRSAVAMQLGIPWNVVKRPTVKIQAIDAARSVLPTCEFDEQGCADGLKRLSQYRKAWKEALNAWSDQPVHDINSHGADAFMTFATGYQAPPFHEEDEDWAEHEEWRSAEDRNEVSGY